MESVVMIDLTGPTASLDRMLIAAETLEQTAFPAIIADFHAAEAAVFASEGPDWTPLAASTLAHKRGPRILEETGALKNSLSSSNAPGSVVRMAPDELFIGTDVSYAQYHQHGTRRMPARPIILVHEMDALRWSAIVSALLLAGPKL